MNPDVNYSFPITHEHLSPQEIWEERYGDRPPVANPTEYTRTLEGIVAKLLKRDGFRKSDQPTKVLKKALAMNTKLYGHIEKLKESNVKLRVERNDLKEELRALKSELRKTKGKQKVAEMVMQEERERVVNEGWRKFNQSMNRKNPFMFPRKGKSEQNGAETTNRCCGEEVNRGLKDREDVEENDRAKKRRRTS